MTRANGNGSARACLSTAVDDYFLLLRQAIEECGWTIEALATEMNASLPEAMQFKGASGGSHLWRMLHNERPWRVEHVVALPDDVEIVFATKYAESFGLIVVKPVEGPQAARNFVSGLFGLLLHQLPAKASVMAKADLPAANSDRMRA